MNKLLVLTGGTKGIGKAIIQKFAQNQFDIFTCARNQADLAQLKVEIERDFSVQLHTQVADLSKKNDTMAFARKVLELERPVDVLVNNTGVFLPGSVIEEEEGALETMIDTNLYSAYHLTRALISPMIQNQEGYIFNMCSIASVIAYPNGGSYSISKFALYGMTKVLREELKEHGIRVSAVLPGATLTASWAGVDIPAQRFMKPEDVAEAVYSAYAMSKQSVVEEILIRPQLGDL